MKEVMVVIMPQINWNGPPPTMTASLTSLFVASSEFIGRHSYLLLHLPLPTDNPDQGEDWPTLYFVDHPPRNQRSVYNSSSVPWSFFFGALFHSLPIQGKQTVGGLETDATPTILSNYSCQWPGRTVAEFSGKVPKRMWLGWAAGRTIMYEYLPAVRIPRGISRKLRPELENIWAFIVGGGDAKVNFKLNFIIPAWTGRVWSGLVLVCCPNWR